HIMRTKTICLPAGPRDCCDACSSRALRSLRAPGAVWQGTPGTFSSTCSAYSPGGYAERDRPDQVAGRAARVLAFELTFAESLSAIEHAKVIASRTDAVRPPVRLCPGDGRLAGSAGRQFSAPDYCQAADAETAPGDEAGKWRSAAPLPVGKPGDF